MSGQASQGAEIGAILGPNQADVDALRDLLDLMADFSGNDQRARYLLTSNWMRDHEAAVSRRHLTVALALLSEPEYVIPPTEAAS